MWEDTRQLDISGTRPDTWQEWERGYQNAIDRYYGLCRKACVELQRETYVCGITSQTASTRILYFRGS